MAGAWLGGDGRTGGGGGQLRAQFTAAMDDDLNAPRAVAALFDFVPGGEPAAGWVEGAAAELRAAWVWAGQVLDVAARRACWTCTLDRQVRSIGEPAGLEWKRVGVQAGRNGGSGKKRRDFKLG